MYPLTVQNISKFTIFARDFYVETCSVIAADVKDQVVPKAQLREGYKVEAIKFAKASRNRIYVVQSEINSNVKIIDEYYGGLKDLQAKKLSLENAPIVKREDLESVQDEIDEFERTNSVRISSLERKNADLHNFLETIEADLRTYHQGTISHENHGFNTYNVKFDDGDEDENLDETLIRELPNHPFNVQKRKTSNVIPNGGKTEYYPLALRNSLSANSAEDTASQWYIESRFKLRNEGDVIYNDDFVVLRSVKLKNKKLTIAYRSWDEKPSKEDIMNSRYTRHDHLVGVGSDEFMRNGWQLKLVQSNNLLVKARSLDVQHSFVLGGDFVRLQHREAQGVLITRLDDNKEFNSAVAPLGILARKSLKSKASTHGVYVRSKRSKSRSNDHLHVLPGSSVWQIIADSSQHGFGVVSDKTPIRLRNVLSGQLLCIRNFLRRRKENDCRWEIDDDILQNAAYITEEKKPDMGCILATTGQLDDDSLFRVCSIDDGRVDDGSNSRILYNRNIYIEHMKTKRTLGIHEKSLSSVADTDCIARPVDISPSAINKNSLAFESVDIEEVRDIFYVSKFMNIVMKCIYAIQNDVLDDLYLPLFRHWHVSLHTLILWLSDPSHKCDASLIPASQSRTSHSGVDAREHSEKETDMVDLDAKSDEHDFETDSSRDQYRGIVSLEYRGVKHASSLGLWCGRLNITSKNYTSEDLVVNVSSRKGEGYSRLNRSLLDHRHRRIIDRRQNLLRESKLLEMLMHYNGIVYTLLQAQDKERKSRDYVDYNDNERLFRVPDIIRETCVIVYDLVRISIHENSVNAMHLLKIQGIFMSMIRHEVAQLSPPIETILVSAENTGTANVLSPHEVQHLIKQMFDLHLLKGEAAQHILSLLSVLACPGGGLTHSGRYNNMRPNTNFQDIALEIIFDAVERSDIKEDALNESISCLFSTRFSLNNDWEIMIRPPVLLDEAKVERADLVIKLEEEFSSLIEFFKKYNTNDAKDDEGSEYLDIGEVELLLQDLGLGGSTLQREMEVLLDANFADFICWCWQHRNDHLSTSSTLLRDLKPWESFELLFGHSSREDELLVERRRSQAQTDIQEAMMDILGVDETNALDKLNIDFDHDEKGLDSREDVNFDHGDDYVEDEDGGDDVKEGDVNNSDLDDIGIDIGHVKDHSMQLTGAMIMKTKFDTFKNFKEREKYGDVKRLHDRVETLRLQYEGSVATMNTSLMTALAAKKFTRGIKHHTKEKNDAMDEYGRPYQGITITLTTDFISADKRIEEIQLANSHYWEKLDQLISHDSYERRWFRNALYFLSTLCRGNNLISQRTISRLVPAELLLSLLHTPGVEITDKYLACEMICCIYIENDLVFPIQPRRHDEVKMIGCDEFSGARDNLVMTAGKAFNSFSRERVDRGCLDGEQLRKLLRSYIKKELESMTFTCDDLDDKLKFDGCLLHLCRMLLQIGYFEEEMHHESLLITPFTDTSHDDKVDNGWSTLLKCLKSSEGSKKVTEFGFLEMEQLMIQKLNNFHSKLMVVGSESANSTLERISPNASSDSVDFYSKTIDPSSGVDEISFAYFDVIFSNRLRINVMRELILSLTVCYNIDQIHKICELSFRLLADNEDFYVPPEYKPIGFHLAPVVKGVKDKLQDALNWSISEGKNDTVASVDLSWGLSTDTKIAKSTPGKAFSTNISGQSFTSYSLELIKNTFAERDARNENYVKATLFTTLFKDIVLQHETYDMLVRQLFPRRDACSMLKTIKILPTEEEAKIRRLIQIFHRLMLKHLASVLKFKSSSTFLQRKLATDVIGFCLNGIKSLCYVRLKRKYDDELTSFSAIRPINVVRETLEKVNKQGADLSRRLVKWGRRKMTSLHSAIYERSRTEDGIELMDDPVRDPFASDDGSNYVDDDKKNEEEDSTPYEYDYELDDLVFDVTPVFDTSLLLKEVVTLLCDALDFLFCKKNHDDDKKTQVRAWDDIDAEDKILLDISGEFLLPICYNSLELTMICIKKVRFVVEYVEVSEGCLNLLTLMCRHARSGRETSKDFEFILMPSISMLRTLMSKSIDWRNKYPYKIIQVFIAILQNEAMPREIIREVHSLISNNILRNGDMRDAVFTPNYFLSCESSRRFNLQTLRLLSLFHRGERGVRSEREELKAILPTRHCQEVLENPRYPLLIKSTILQMGSSLYNYNNLRTVDFIIEDLNRISRTIDSPLGIEYLDNHRFSIDDFIFMGCVPALTRIALQSKLLRDEEVSEVVKSLRLQQSQLDKVVSHTEKVRRLFSSNVVFASRVEQELKPSEVDNTVVINDDLTPPPRSVVDGLAQEQDYPTPSHSESPVRQYRASVGQCQPSLYFDSILSLADTLFTSNGALLMVLDRDTSDKMANKASHLEWLFAAAIVLVTRLGASDKEGGSRFSFVLRALKENAIQFIQWISDHRRRLRSRSFIRTRGAKQFNDSLRKILHPQEILPTWREHVFAERKELKFKHKDFRHSFDSVRVGGFLTHRASMKSLSKTVLYKIFKEYTTMAQSMIKYKGLSAGETSEDSENNKGHERHKTREAQKFMKGVSPFNNWNRCRGKYLENLFHYIGLSTLHVSKTFVISNCFMDIFSLILKNNVYKIRATSSVIYTKEQVKTESDRVQRIQNTLNEFKAGNALLQIIGRARNVHVRSNYFSILVPEALAFGYALMDTGNQDAQNHMVDQIISSKKNDKIPEMEAMIALRSIIRTCKSNIERGFKINKPLGDLAPLINNLLRVFEFCGRLCNGHNERARNFLREQDKSAHSVDIVSDIVGVNNVIMEVLVSRMKYINYEIFTEKLAPMIWQELSSERRKFIAWHEHDVVKFDVVCRLMHMVNVGFAVLKDLCQGPCYENQKIGLKATNMCPLLLEYIGSMHMNAESLVARLLGPDRKVMWKGHDPYDFYATYRKELQHIRAWSSDPTKDMIEKFLEDWSSTKSSLFHPGVIRTRSKKTADILGVDIDLLLDVSRKAEISCLKMLLALMEGSDKHITNTLKSSLDVGILLQNMENVYLQSNMTTLTRDQTIEAKNLFVLYLTLNETLAAEEDVHSFGIDDLLTNWKEMCRQEGKDVDQMVASVEIIGKNGRVQRTYYPKPLFVNQYWLYPETQKAKEYIVNSVCRNSAEEKISDFYGKMKGLRKVMKRQEVLRYLLTPFFHSFLGGSSGISFFDENKFLPDQRKWFLYMTFLINIHWMYTDFQKHEEERDMDYVGGGMYRKFLNWSGHDLFLLMFYSIHFGVACLLFLRDVLNSRVADELDSFLFVDDDLKTSNTLVGFLMKSNAVRVFLFLWQKIQVNAMIIYESAWMTTVVIACFGGLWGFIYDINLMWLYSIPLLDIAWQIQAIAFLAEAMKRNMARIFWSMVIIVIILYIYSVLTYMFFREKYGLGNFEDDNGTCADLIDCFRLHVDFGLNSPPEWEERPFVYVGGGPFEVLMGGFLGSLYNLSYVVIINLILQAIYSTLIMDTFGEMREAADDLEDDCISRCFICSIDKDEFEQAEINYSKHIGEEHHMWNYLFFQIYLDEKDPLSFSGPEHYAFSQMQDKQKFIRLVPIKKSLSLERKNALGGDDDAMVQVQESIESIGRTQRRILNYIREGNKHNAEGDGGELDSNETNYDDDEENSVNSKCADGSRNEDAASTSTDAFGSPR